MTNTRTLINNSRTLQDLLKNSGVNINEAIKRGEYKWVKPENVTSIENKYLDEKILELKFKNLISESDNINIRINNNKVTLTYPNNNTQTITLNQLKKNIKEHENEIKKKISRRRSFLNPNESKEEYKTEINKKKNRRQSFLNANKVERNNNIIQIQELLQKGNPNKDISAFLEILQHSQPDGVYKFLNFVKKYPTQIPKILSYILSKEFNENNFNSFFTYILSEEFNENNFNSFLQNLPNEENISNKQRRRKELINSI